MIYLANPRRLVPRWAWDMLRLWRLFQGGMSLGVLPEMAGTMDQSPKMMDAFSVMSAFEAELKEEGGKGGSGSKWTKKQIEQVQAGIAKAKELYPDGPASGALLEATLKARRGGK